MATYFAKIEDNKVTQVIVADQSFVDSIGGTWVETWMDGGARKNYAGIGFTYDAAKDHFVAPQPFPSWVLNANTQWEAPIAMPTDGKFYTWNETDKKWDVANV